MTNFSIPNALGQIRTASRTETFGELNETFSVDLNNPFGKIKSSKVLTKVLDETDFSDDRVQALAVYYKQGSISAPRYYAISNGAVMTCTTSNDPTDSSNWSEETNIATSGFGDETDAVVFDDKLIISRAEDLLSWDDSTDDNNWGTTVANIPALTANYPHILHPRSGNGGEFLFVTDSNKVHYTEIVGGSGNASTITLAADRVACCVDSGLEATWVGTYSNSNNKALVYEIYTGEQKDGIPTARNAYEVDGRAVLSLVVVGNTPYIITDKGNLQMFDSAGFTTVAQLPFSGTPFTFDGMRIGNVQEDNNERPVHPKGMRSSNDSIFININTEAETVGATQDPYPKDTPSGIYEYNTATKQLHHRYSFNKAKYNNYTGPLMIIDSPYAFLMAGTEINDTTAGLYMDSSEYFGYVITKEIESGTVQDSFEAQYIKAKQLADDDSIDLKYRISKQDRQFFDYTLANTNVLNTTDTVTVAVGDEITLIDNVNVGKIAHVTKVENSTTVTSITVDADLGTGGDTGTAESINFQRFTKTVDGVKVSDAYTVDDIEFKKYGSDKVNPWIQFKIVFNGEVEMRQFMSKGTAKTER